jgi:Mycoplasma protein of unknown function, DUF285
LHGSLGLQDSYSFNQDLSPWDVDQVAEMTDMFHHAKSFGQTLCWDLSGKILGSIFNGTLGGSANSNTSQCWEDKHYHKQHSDDNNGGASATDKTGTSLKVQSVSSLHFLQAILCAFVVASATYWVILLRRYLKSQNNKRWLEQNVMERAACSPEDGPQHDRTERTQRQNDDFNFSLDEDEVEIMFENNMEIEELRRKCFSQSFDSVHDEKTDDDKSFMSATYELPVLTTLLLQQEESLRRLREARQAGKSGAAVNSSYTNNQFLPESLESNAAKLEGNADTIDGSVSTRAPWNHHALAPPSHGSREMHPPDMLVEADAQRFRSRQIQIPRQIYQIGGISDLYDQPLAAQNSQPTSTTSAGYAADEAMNKWVYQNVETRTITLVSQTKSYDADVALRRRNGVDIV